MEGIFTLPPKTVTTCLCAAARGGERGQTAHPCGIFLAPVLVPDVEGYNEDNDDDGGKEHHPHDEEGGAGHSGAVGQGRRCALHPAPEGQGERHRETNRRAQSRR
jgi:hypothetical protein